jgi:hypothetical protein
MHIELKQQDKCHSIFAIQKSTGKFLYFSSFMGGIFLNLFLRLK